jgi:cytidylate kinase
MYFITLSRQLGTKGTEVAELVAKELQYALYGKEEIERKAQELGFLDDIRAVNDKGPSPLKRYFSWKPEIYLNHLYSVIYDLTRQGSAVLLGRGGNMLLRIPNALHVRVIASQETRVNHLVQNGYKRDAAFMCMKKSDRERKKFFKYAFHRDWDNSDLYDIILNMDHLTVKAAADTILCAARLREFPDHSGNGNSSLDMMDLLARLWLALSKVGFQSGYVSASVTAPGKVRLTGVVKVPRERLAAELTALEVEGVESVENQIKITSAG